MKTTSAGLILTDGSYFLGCHSTQNPFFDLPKGKIEGHETPIEACIRETYEETNLIIHQSRLVDLGLHEYNNYKNLHLFMLPLDRLPKINLLKCNSFRLNEQKGKLHPEVDGFMYIKKTHMKHFLTKNMFHLLDKILIKKRIA